MRYCDLCGEEAEYESFKKRFLECQKLEVFVPELSYKKDGGIFKL